MRAPALLPLLFAVLLGACAADSPRQLVIAPADYPTAFDAAKRVLRDAQFDLDRVDARAGIITTDKRPATGLAAPWESQQSTAAQELEDFVQHQQRWVRITFESPGPEPAGGEGGAHDPVTQESVMYVRVILDRIYRPGWRLSTTAINLSSHATDPALVQRAMQPQYDVAYSEDHYLAARLTQDIEKRVSPASAP